MSETTINAHDDYSLMYDNIIQIRDVIKGSPFIKDKGTTYLEHPSSVDKDPQRYREFISGAEFDEFTGNTERVMIGRMKLDDAKFEPDSRLSYLQNDVDGDGLSMRGLIESCCSNVMEVKWHVLLSDYKGFTSAPLDAVSMQDIQDAKQRATIKQYARESLLDWGFSRINGVYQVDYMVLCESCLVRDPESGDKSTIESYLKLAIDDIGYYQQKQTSSLLSENGWGEKHYILVGGKNLKFIPVSIVCDEEFAAGCLPQQLGFLSAIGDLALYRYRVSAKYKEALAALVPTMHVTGVSNTDWEIFKEVNGRSYVSSGAFDPNIWPSENTKFQLIESKQSLQQFIDYFEDNKNKVRAAGGVFKTDNTVQRTATEVLTEAETTTSILRPIADNVESAVVEQVAYCAMFEGLVSQDDVYKYTGEVELALSKEFAINKLSVEEVKVLLDVYMTGLLPKDEFLTILEMGGWTNSSAEDLLKRIEEQAPI